MKKQRPSYGEKSNCDFAIDQLEPSVKGLAGLRFEAFQATGLAFCEQRFGRTDADLLAGDRFPDHELASLLPTAATVGFSLLPDFGSTQRAIPKPARRRNVGLLRPHLVQVARFVRLLSARFRFTLPRRGSISGTGMSVTAPESLIDRITRPTPASSIGCCSTPCCNNWRISPSSNS